MPKQKKTKKANANLEILKNQKKPKKKQCQFTDFGVATGFFFGEHPPNGNVTGKSQMNLKSLLIIHLDTHNTVSDQSVSCCTP